MQYLDLVSTSDLEGMDGAPFSQARVKAAAETVRRMAGWHIAPSTTEVVTVDHDGGSTLLLRSLYVTDVVAVRDVSGPTPRELTGWRWSQAGMISFAGGGPCGFRSVEVEFVHGYESCPADLLPVIASSIERRIVQESLGSRSVTLANDDLGMGASSVLSMYSIRARP